MISTRRFCARPASVSFDATGCASPAPTVTTRDVTTPRPDVFYARLTREAAGRDLGVTGFTSPDDSIQALFEALVR